MTSELAPEFSDAFRTRYRLLRLLGEGGMGRVYEGLHLELDRRVAIKVMLRQTDPVEIARFEREGRVLATLKHPQILGVFEAGLDGSVPYMVSELVEGRTLRERMNGPLPLDTALEIASGVARALAFAHASGVLHRDVKPENVFILGESSVKLGDFGLARNAGAGATVTTPGIVMGSPGYMAPELLRDGAISPTVDQYALGVMLYEMLSGRLPFLAKDPSRALTMRLSEDPPSLAQVCPELPRTVTRLVTRLIARDPRERFASLEAVVLALEEIGASRDTITAPPLPPVASGKTTSSTRTRAVPTSASLSMAPGGAIPENPRAGVPAVAGARPGRLPLWILLLAGGLLAGLASGRWIQARIEDIARGFVLKVRALSLGETFLTWTHNSVPMRLPIRRLGHSEILLDATLSGAEDLELVSAGAPVIAVGPLFDEHAAPLVAALRELPVEAQNWPDRIPEDKKQLLARAAPVAPSWMIATSDKFVRFELMNLLYRMEAVDSGLAKEGKGVHWRASDLLPGHWRETAHVPADRDNLLWMHGPTTVPARRFPLMLDTLAVTMSLRRDDPRWIHFFFDNFGFVCDDPPRLRMDLIKGQELEKRGKNLLPFQFELEAADLENVREARFGFVAVDPYMSVIVVEINDQLTMRYSLPKVEKGEPFLNGRTRGIPADVFRPGKNTILVRTEYCPVRNKAHQVYFDSFVLTLYRHSVGPQ